MLVLYMYSFCVGCIIHVYLNTTGILLTPTDDSDAWPSCFVFIWVYKKNICPVLMFIIVD